MSLDFKICKAKDCGQEFNSVFSKYRDYCSSECYKASKKSDLKLKSFKTPKKKCRICKESFEPKNNFIPVCDNVDCKTKYAMSVVEKQKKSQEAKERKSRADQKKQLTIDMMSDDKYRSKVLQPVINEIARLIDFGQPCIATENYGKENGGHYISVGANRTICINLHNIHIQSFESNHWKSGDTLKYQGGIRRVYGEEYLAFMDGLQKHPPIQLRKNQMIEIYENACKIRLKLRKNEKIRSPKERIELRNQTNLELGVYQEEFCVFT